MRTMSKQSGRNSTSSSRVKRAKHANVNANVRPACPWCSGSGKQPAFPDLSLMNQRRLADGAGVSESLVCRMLSDNPKVRRANPTLKTLKGLQRCIEAERGVRVPLDMIAELISGQ